MGKTKGKTKAKRQGTTQSQRRSQGKQSSAPAVKPLPNSKQSWKLDDEAKGLLLQTLAVSPTVAQGARNFEQLSGISLTRQRAAAVIAEQRERYEAICEEHRQRHYESPLLFASNRARELNEMWQRAGSDTDRLVLMDHFRKESEIMGVEAMPSAKAKEVEAFLRSVEFGQDDIGEVPEHPRPTVHN